MKRTEAATGGVLWKLVLGLQLYLKKTLVGVFSCEFCEIIKNTFTEHLWTTASRRSETTVLSHTFCLEYD